MKMKECIEDETWFKCEVDGITYDCALEYTSEMETDYFSGSNFRDRRYIERPLVDVIVRKYRTAKIWLFEFGLLDFEYECRVPVDSEYCELVNGTIYYDVETAKTLVAEALRRREEDVIKTDKERKRERELNVVKEIR